ncbi:helix-turn-helix transcriptional regulator [Clostridium sp. Marseille-Q2269]|uniref:helix-turn-helix domain-containing protein n=1 Tax=Clostridium sp. Marseille-Q2269 TaxID=2942205 RepID=UPI002073512E|nr:helix-turn-helix transcriptional regulator [Clostridium sp. Marseille-Q2269]
MVFKDRLKGLREDRDLTQDQIADVLNTTRSAVANYENGIREPDIHLLVKIADYFNISLDYLLCRTNKMEPFYTSKRKSKLLLPVIYCTVIQGLFIFI